MKIKHCRSCKFKKLSKVYNLGRQTLTGIFPPSPKSKVTKGNLSMVICNNCKLLQLEDNFNQEIDELSKETEDLVTEIEKWQM